MENFHVYLSCLKLVLPVGCLGGIITFLPLSHCYLHRNQNMHGSGVTLLLLMHYCLFPFSHPLRKLIDMVGERAWHLYFLFFHPLRELMGVYRGIGRFLEDRIWPPSSPSWHLLCNYSASFRHYFKHNWESTKCPMSGESQDFLSPTQIPRTSLLDRGEPCRDAHTGKCSPAMQIIKITWREGERLLPPSKNEYLQCKCKYILIQISTLNTDLPPPYLLGCSFYAWKIQPIPNSTSSPHPFETETWSLDCCECLVL